ncbi:U5 small nuclear ribonucleoprotein 40 kDa protein-like [Episyrphus balteatus]|uniref:U5 small nuclear ribonucleoprotein 40 kDa protein-like n=1 Tax=Episyrphus balteatus TaxID=286459 RepID=UPI002486667F|nr:U5 small nuclear ribonucleoprotein 40 kDa protein-like [Episyrphus balteatus]
MGAITNRRSPSWIKRMEPHKRTHFNPLGAPALSSLRAPIVRIEDHKSEVTSCDFHPSGKFILSGNSKGQIYLCDIYGTFSKTMLFKGHADSVTETHFSRDGFDFYTCSKDGTIGIWDTFRGYRKARLECHEDGVNCVQGGRLAYPILCSGSDDGTVRLWDAREKECVLTLNNTSTVTATCFTADGDYVISGGHDSDIKIWDLRTCEIVCKLRGHIGKVTGLSLSPCGSYLLSHSVDNTLRVWDIRPHVTFKRCVGCFSSYQFFPSALLRCAWSPDGTMISAGTSDRDVFVWDALTGETLHELSGHESAINDVTFHPKESIILSASKDNYLFLHEL